MRAVGIAFIVFLLSGVIGCGSSKNKEIQRIMDSPIVYNSHLSPWAKLDSYTTWNFVPMPVNSTIDPRAANPMLRGEIQRAIERHMSVRGFRKVSTRSDLLVNYHVATQDITQEYIQRMYDGSYLPEYRMDFSGPRSSRKAWREGSVIIFLFDVATEKMVWQSSATAEIADQPPEDKSKKRLNTAIKTMFTSLPGKSTWQRTN